MTLRQYAQALRRRWKIVTASVLLFLGLGAVLTGLMSPLYVASATNFVSTTGGTSQQSQLYSNSQYALNQVASYVEIIHSPTVLQPVITSLGLKDSVGALAKKITATNPASTALIVVKARAGNAAQAQAMANLASANLAREIERLETPRDAKSSSVKVTTAVPATLPRAPVSPRKTLNLTLALLLGIGVGAVGAIIRDQLDTTVKVGGDLETEGVGLLGVVRYDAALRREPLVALKRRASGIEDFRTIRTNLQFTDVDKPPRQIVVSSAVANEGKTLTVCNLAITMAQADLKVCLVEGDLRRPKVTRYLGIDGSLGLSDVAAGLYTADQVLVPWRRNLLTVLPAGTTPPDPIRLLGSRATKELFEELRERFDVVLIDAPPLLPVSDAALLGGTSDGVILVARHHHVRREQFAMAVSRLTSVNATIIGAILTQVPARDRQARYGGDYEYTSVPHLDVVAATQSAAGQSGSGQSESGQPTRAQSSNARSTGDGDGAIDGRAV